MDQVDEEAQDMKFIQLLEGYAELSEAMIILSKIREIHGQALYIKQNSLKWDIPVDNEFSEYKYLEEQDIVEYNKEEAITENQAQIRSLKQFSEIFDQFKKEMAHQFLKQQDQFIPKLINGLPKLRQELLVKIHILKLQMMKNLMSFNSELDINQFPMSAIESGKLYLVIASIIKQNIFDKRKLINISKEQDSMDILIKVLESVKARKIISSNLFFVIMNTFGLALQNDSLATPFMKSLFSSNYLFNLDSKFIDTNDMIAYNQMDQWNYQNQQYQNQEFFQRFKEQFKDYHKDESKLRDILSTQIIPEIKQNWMEIRQQIKDMVQFVEQSSRFQQGILSFKSYYNINQNLEVIPLSQVQINFFYIPDKNFQGCTLMNGDIIINLRVLAQKLEKDNTLDIKQILKQIVLYILIHEYGHIIQRFIRQTWIFQTTSLQNQSGVERCFNKESGEIMEIIIFGFKKENDSQLQKDNNKQELKDNDKQDLENNDKQDLKDNQSDRMNQSGNINSSGSIDSSGKSNNIICLSKSNDSQNINSNSLYSIQKTIQQGVDDDEFMNQILDQSYWSQPICRQYPISELVINSIKELNQYYLKDELNFKYIFDIYKLNDIDQIDLEGFAQFMKSFKNQFLDQDSVIINTYNYINYHEQATIPYYKIQMALELVQCNTMITDKEK